jgi:hypothetical protein
MSDDQATYGLADQGPDDLSLTRRMGGLQATHAAMVF